MKQIKQLIVNILDTLGVVIAGLSWLAIVGICAQIWGFGGFFMGLIVASIFITIVFGILFLFLDINQNVREMTKSLKDMSRELANKA